MPQLTQALVVLLRSAVNVGVSSDLSFNEKQKLWLTNAGALLAMAASGVYMLTSFYIWDSILNASFNLLSIFIFSCVLWLNKAKMYQYSSTVYLILMLLICYMNIIMYGSNLMLYLIMIPWLVLAVFLLDSPLLITTAVIVGVFSFVFFESYSNYFQPLFNDNSYLPSRISIGLALSSFVVILLFYKGNHDNYERIIKAKNEDLEFQQGEIALRNKQLQEQKEEIQSQNQNLKFINKEMTASIVYSKRIQTALLPDMDKCQHFFAEHFVFFKPKDIVSGDFYWSAINNNSLLFAVADCTGHGVPGAMMTAICHSILQNAVFEAKLSSPAKILTYANERLQATLNHSVRDNVIIRDGMDISLCMIEQDSSEIVFAGAKRSLYHISEDGFDVIKGGKQSIGGGVYDKNYYQQEIVPYKEGDCFYMLTDGITDQFGGPNNKKFLTRQIKEFIASAHSLPMDRQFESLELKMDNWKGKHDQTDDMLMVGFRM